MNTKSSFMAGSNHKTGTVWMHQIVGDFCTYSQRYFRAVSGRPISDDDVDLPGPVVLFDNHSIFDDPNSKTAGMTGFTMIRHPKDQIISATRYHKVSEESWLHEEHEKYDGMTYQEKIKSIEDWESSVIFEMKNASLLFTKNVLQHDIRLMRIKYEDLITGYPYPKVFDELFEYLKFDKEDRHLFTKFYKQNHIVTGYKNSHVADGSIDQWKKYWTPKCDLVYQRLFGDIEYLLGYN